MNIWVHLKVIFVPLSFIVLVCIFKQKAVLKAEAIIQHNLYPDIMTCL